MSCSFYKWYSQALGGTLGIIACIFGYLNGYMFVYTNISNNFDYLGFDGIISSYLLLPMCIATLLLGVIRSYSEDKEYLCFSFKSVNVILSAFTIILGFLGAKMYFIFPTLFIVLSFLSINTNNKKDSDQLDNNNTENNVINQTINNNEDVNTKSDKNENTIEYATNHTYTNDGKEAKLLMTRRDIVVELLSKGSNLEFISDITGFSLNEIKCIEEESTK